MERLSLVMIPAGFEEVACEICGKNQRRLVAARPDLFLGGDTVYTMYECLGCGIIYQYPRPSAARIGDFYPSDYQQYTPGVHRENPIARFFRRYGLKKRCGLIQKYVDNGRLLDVGCATGDFLSEMQEQPHWQVVGIEPSYSALRYAHDEIGLDVVEGVLNDAPFMAQSFDAITMWDVLEHVFDPRVVIERAARLLRPGGILVVNHPNLESLDRRWFANLWLGYELPRHLYVFPTRLLRQLMNDVGLIEVDRICLYGSHAATASSVMFVIEKRWGNGRFSQIMRNILFSRVIRILATPYFKWVDSKKLGSNVTAIFRKTV